MATADTITASPDLKTPCPASKGLRQDADSQIQSAWEAVNAAYTSHKTEIEDALKLAVPTSARMLASAAFRRGPLLSNCQVLHSRTNTFLSQSYLQNDTANTTAISALQTIMTELKDNCKSIEGECAVSRTTKAKAYIAEAELEEDYIKKMVEETKGQAECRDGSSQRTYEAQVLWYLRCKLLLSRITVIHTEWTTQLTKVTTELTKVATSKLIELMLITPMTRIQKNYIAPMLINYQKQCEDIWEMKYRRGYTERLCEELQEVVQTLQTMLVNQLVLTWAIQALQPFLEVHMALAGVYTLPLWYREAHAEDRAEGEGEGQPLPLGDIPYHHSAVANIRSIPWQYLETKKVCKETKSFRLHAQTNYLLTPAKTIVAEFGQAMREAMYYLDHMLDVCERQSRGEPPIGHHAPNAAAPYEDMEDDNDDPRVMPPPWPAELLLAAAALQAPRAPALLPLAPLVWRR
jgi:hypothetical protein